MRFKRNHPAYNKTVAQMAKSYQLSPKCIQSAMSGQQSALREIAKVHKKKMILWNNSPSATETVDTPV